MGVRFVYVRDLFLIVLGTMCDGFGIDFRWIWDLFLMGLGLMLNGLVMFRAMFVGFGLYILFCENRFRNIRDMSPFRGCERREAERGRSK